MATLTRTKSAIGLFLLAGGLFLAVCAATYARNSPAADRAALDEIRRQIRDAENAGDVAVFARFAADDVAVMPPKAGLILGRETNLNAMRDFFEKFELHIDYSRPVVEVRGDFAIERGIYSQTVKPKAGGEAVASRGCYLWVYRRLPGGGWEQSHAIWNES